MVSPHVSTVYFQVTMCKIEILLLPLPPLHYREGISNFPSTLLSSWLKFLVTRQVSKRRTNRSSHTQEKPWQPESLLGVTNFLAWPTSWHNSLPTSWRDPLPGVSHFLAWPMSSPQGLSPSNGKRCHLGVGGSGRLLGKAQ